MTTVTVTYTLPEDGYAYETAYNSASTKSVVVEVHQLVRNQLKHGIPEGDRVVLEVVRDMLSEVGV
jgi:hypothetical protein